MPESISRLDVISRIAALEIKVEMLVDDTKEIKRDVKEINDWFLRAKGFKGALYLLGFILLAIGASFSQALKWLLEAIK